MPGKKKKFNARFPPARIKKIMQKDEEVGKVAIAVPVIVSRALEGFIKSLILEASKTTKSRNAKTLSPFHIKQAIEGDKQYDFLRGLVANISQGDDDDETTGDVKKPRGKKIACPQTSTEDQEATDTDESSDTEMEEEPVTSVIHSNIKHKLNEPTSNLSQSSDAKETLSQPGTSLVIDELTNNNQNTKISDSYSSTVLSNRIQDNNEKNDVSNASSSRLPFIPHPGLPSNSMYPLPKPENSKQSTRPYNWHNHDNRTNESMYSPFDLSYGNRPKSQSSHTSVEREYTTLHPTHVFNSNAGLPYTPSPVSVKQPYAHPAFSQAPPPISQFHRPDFPLSSMLSAQDFRPPTTL